MSEIISDSTRKIRKSLLFISTAAIIYWFLELKILKLTISGSETIITHSERIPIVITIIIIYFLSFLVYYTIIDLKVWYAQIKLKPFEDRIKIHLSGMNEGDKTLTHDALKGIYDEEVYNQEISKINKYLKTKFWIDIIIPIIVSIFAIIVVLLIL